MARSFNLQGTREKSLRVQTKEADAKNPRKYSTCEGCRLIADKQVMLDTNEEADIVFVGGFPTSTDIDRGAFVSKGGFMLRNIIKEVKAKCAKNKTPQIAYSYGVQCCPESVGFKLKVDDINKCKRHMWAHIDRMKPKLIVALGKDALISLNLNKSVASVRGNLQNVSLEGTTVKVMATFHPAAIMKDPGLVPTFVKDIKAAFQYVLYSFEDEVFNLRTPVKYKDIIQELSILEKKLIDAENKGEKVDVAIDTETTSLNPYDPTQRMIAVSYSAEEDDGVAFPWKHCAALFTDHEYQSLKKTFNDIMKLPAINLVMHNAKFDQQWLHHKYQLDMPICDWDTLLVEHMLDEDKKGHYGLKELTSQYFPGSAKYEEELQNELARLKQERADRMSEAREKYKDSLMEIYLKYWTSLSESELLTKRLEVSDKLDLSLEKAEKLIPKYRKLKKKDWVYDEDGALVNNLSTTLLQSSKKNIFSVLRQLTPRDLGIPEDWDIPELPKEEKEITFEDVDLGVMLTYAARDAVLTRKIKKAQEILIEEEEKKIKMNEAKMKMPTKPFHFARRRFAKPMQHIISGMEYHGVRIDRDKLLTYIHKLDGAIEEARDTFIQEAGDKINLGSPAELANLLYEELQFPVLKYTDSGAPSVDAETIKFLADENDNPILDALLTYRKLTKCRDTYLKNWYSMSSIDGHLHGQFHLNGTATYRLSSSKPNLQNVPYQLKEANLNLKALFIPDSEKYDFYDLDIANAEMRILCAYSQDPDLIKAFNEGMDLHCLTASAISGIDYDQIYANKEDKTTNEYRVRQIAKKVDKSAFYKSL